MREFATESAAVTTGSPTTGSPPTGSATGPLIEIDALSKSYGPVLALDKLSLRLDAGAVGLLGPNGSGKTTLLKLLLGLLESNGGRARIAGEDPSTLRGRLALRRAIGYMPEGDCLIPGQTAVELVSTLGRLSGMRGDDAMTRAHEVLDYVGLDEARYRECDGYSTGMKQRLKLAQALVHDPRLLLLDEPTNGLDPKGRKHMLELVHDLGHAQGKSMLLCSHLLPDVERTCDGVIVLQKGRVVASGSIAAMTHRAGFAVRVEVGGDRATFERALEAEGIQGIGRAPHDLDAVHPPDALAVPSKNGVLVLTLPDADCDPLFAIAARSGARILALEPVRSSLEDVFLRSLAAGDAPAVEPDKERAIEDVP
jgi:ABC-2 type transport system ATP-binding protein